MNALSIFPILFLWLLLLHRCYGIFVYRAVASSEKGKSVGNTVESGFLVLSMILMNSMELPTNSGRKVGFRAGAKRLCIHFDKPLTGWLTMEQTGLPG